jgi:hypothetical protein
MGKLEHIFPFMSMRLPRRLWSTRFFRNLRLNKRKVTSHIDTYKTLVHFLYMNKRRALVENTGLSDSDDDQSIRKCTARFKNSVPHVRNMRGVSLFESLPADRSCKDAMVPLVYCACQNQTNLVGEEARFLNETGGFNFTSTALFIVQAVNAVASSFENKYRDKCEPFRLDRVVSVMMLDQSKRVYKVRVRMVPGQAVFQAVVRFESVPSGDAKIKLVGKVTRTSWFGSQSDCVPEHALKGFCFCKN